MNHLNNENDQVNAVAPAIDEFLDDDDNEDDDEDAEDGDDVFDPAEGERICQEAMTLLQNRLNVPSRLRDRTIVRFAQQFINNVKDDIYKMFTDTNREEEGYEGLDSERDTEAEVETAIRCDPDVLTREDERFGNTQEDDRSGLYPIQCLTIMEGDNRKLLCNVKAVAFVPLFARLAIEFHSFYETERGGLLVEDGVGDNVLHDLMHSSDHKDDHYHQHVDTTFLAVLIRLRQAGLLTIGDIQHYELVHELCQYDSHLAIRRFRFLTEWCPPSLITTSSNKEDGVLPLHGTVRPSYGSIEDFQMHVDALFHFYPKWKGITALFQKNGSGYTSFEMACEKFTRNAVLDVVEEILMRYTTMTPPVNMGDALMMAAIDDSISLDGVYFFMRRQPDIMLSRLRRDRSHGATETETETETTASLNDINKTSNTNNDTNDGMAVKTNHSNNAIVLQTSTRKRKRT